MRESTRLCCCILQHTCFHRAVLGGAGVCSVPSPWSACICAANPLPCVRAACNCMGLASRAAAATAAASSLSLASAVHPACRCVGIAQKLGVQPLPLRCASRASPHAKHTGLPIPAAATPVEWSYCLTLHKCCSARAATRGTQAASW